MNNLQFSRALGVDPSKVSKIVMTVEPHRTEIVVSMPGVCMEHGKADTFAIIADLVGEARKVASE
jgi:hypothetical protein